MSEARSDSYRADWYPDPSERFELRYFNGSAWTADVCSLGQRYIDPISGDPPPAGGGSGTGGQRNGMAIAALVLGICAIATAWMPYIFVIGALAAGLAVTFGIIGFRRSTVTGSGRGAATAGLITGSLGLCAAVGGFFFTVALSDAIDAYENPGPVEAIIESCREDDQAQWVAEGSITNLDDESHEYSVEVVFTRRGTDNAQRTATINIDELQPGESATFEATRSTPIDDIDCIVASVKGPAPFGFDID